jgi:rhodanese-related sulfurtransferase
VARYLVQNGYEQVVNIAGGIDAWSTEADASVPCY